MNETSNRPVFDRRHYIGGSDARIIMGHDQSSLLRLWREKRGEIEPQDLSDRLIVQLGCVTEDLNRRWYERNTGHSIGQVQRRVIDQQRSWMGATLDGFVESIGAVFEAKFMLPWTFSKEGAAEKHMAQLQHNMLVAKCKAAVLSIITGGGQWVEISVAADPVYQTVLLAVEKAFWQAIRTGEPPRLFDAEPPRARIEAVRVVDMSGSNAWSEFADLYRSTREAHLGHERAKAELKALLPEDVKEATGHGVRSRRSKSGAVTFELVEQSR